MNSFLKKEIIEEKLNLEFEKLLLKEYEINDDDSDYVIFKEKVLRAIDTLRDKRRGPDKSSIFQYIKNSKATSIDDEAITNVIHFMIKENQIVNIKTPQGLDSFFRVNQVLQKDNCMESTEKII